MFNFSWIQLVSTCLLWSWGAKPSTEVEDEASSLMNNYILVNSMFYILVVRSPSIAWFTLCNRVPFWFHALFYIRCVLSGDTSSDWIETNIHRDPQIRWMIWSQLNTRCDSLMDRFTELFYMHVHDCWTLIKNVLIIDCVCKNVRINCLIWRGGFGNLGILLWLLFNLVLSNLHDQVQN